jgi:ribosomal protein S17
MAESTEQAGRSGRKVVVGDFVSNRMHKTIVVEAIRKKSIHSMDASFRRRKSSMRDEKTKAHVGVWAEETRPLSRVKRWRLKVVAKRPSCRKLLPWAWPVSRRRNIRRNIMAVMMRKHAGSPITWRAQAQMILPLGGSPDCVGMGDVITAAVKEPLPTGKPEGSRQGCDRAHSRDIGSAAEPTFDSIQTPPRLLTIPANRSEPAC